MFLSLMRYQAKLISEREVENSNVGNWMITIYSLNCIYRICGGNVAHDAEREPDLIEIG